MKLNHFCQKKRWLWQSLYCACFHHLCPNCMNWSTLLEKHISVIISSLMRVCIWLYRFRWAGPVSKPTITMDCIDTNCTLTCEGKKDGFTKYTWANGIEEWPGSELTVERRDHDVVYTCNFSNPVSWASSHRTVKKHVPPPPDPGQKKWREDVYLCA